jgi:hypothetical protein
MGPSALDPNQIADHLSKRKTEIAEAVDALRKTHDELLAGGTVGLAKISVPTSFVSAGAIAHASPAGAAILAAAGIASWLSRASRRRDTPTINAIPIHSASSSS